MVNEDELSVEAAAQLRQLDGGVRGTKRGGANLRRIGECFIM
jgi:hypothetical protein